MAIEYKTLTLKVPVPRWGSPRFSLRSTLVLVTILSLVLGWWADRRRLQRRIDDLTAAQFGWGTDQVLGPPDTPTPGDHRSAWASATADGRDEWLILEYEKPVAPTAVEIHENYNPGAVSRVSLFDSEGNEFTAWEGVDPTPPTSPAGVSEVEFETTLVTDRVKIYLDSRAVPGWNEVDAVGLRHGDGETLWAVRAYSSSSYGRNNNTPTFGGIVFSR